jgi:hypothetical protein
MTSGIVVTSVGKFATSVGKVVISSGKVITSVGKVVFDTVKVVTQLVTFATTTGQYKTRSAKFVASNHTKASTFAIHAKAPHRAKIAKELAFFPSRKDTFQQLERFLKPHPKKIKTPNSICALT